MAGQHYPGYSPFLPHPGLPPPPPCGYGAPPPEYAPPPPRPAAERREPSPPARRESGESDTAAASPRRPRGRNRKRKNRGRGGENKRRKLKSTPLLHDEEDLQAEPLTTGGVQGPLAVSQSRNGWRAVLHDEKRRTFVSLRKLAFSEQLLAKWWRSCSEQLQWFRPRKEEFILPRSAAWLTKDGCACCYEYSGTQWSPEQMSEWFLEITEAVCRISGISERPNSCNANLYDDGEQSVGWHCDNEPLFNAVAQDALIISLSLGASRWFELVANDDPGQSVRLRLENGDICTMEGLCQKHYRHRVPREAGVSYPRINLTWRWVVRHEEGCPLSIAGAEKSSGSESGGE